MSCLYNKNKRKKELKKIRKEYLNLNISILFIEIF